MTAEVPGPQRRFGLALLAILIAAAGLRLAGIGFGLPLELRPDEEIFREVVVRMAETGDLNPHRFNYGGPLFHATYGAVRAVHFVAHAIDPQAAGAFPEYAKRIPTVALIQRALSALFGVASVFFAWCAGRRLGSDAAGLVAAALLAVLFLPVRDSHFGTVDVPSACASMAAVALLVRASQTGTRGSLVAAGLVAGVATAIRYAPVVLALPLWLVAWRGERLAGRRLFAAAFGPRVWIAAAAMIAGTVISGPYLVLAFPEFRHGFAEVFFTGGQSHFKPVARLADVATSVVRAGDWPFTAAAGVALLVALFGRNPAARAVAIFVAAYTAALSVGTFFFFRWINPILPPLCVLIGWLGARVAQRLPRPGLVCAAIVVGLGALPAFRSLAIDRLFLRETTFEQAARILAERVPAGVPIACPDAGVAKILGSAVAVTPWLSVEERPEWWVVVPRHPMPGIGQDPGWVSAVVAGAGDAERVAELRAFLPSSWNGAEFETGDYFFYPLRGFGALERAGPDIEILKVRSRPRDPAAAGAPPPAVSVAVRSGSVRIVFDPPPGVDVLGYYVKFALEAEAQSGKWFGPYACGLAPLDLPFTNAMRGRWVVQAATVAKGGAGPWSGPTVITVE